jgi:mannosyltransferase OCH1-like enzyme
MIPPLLHFIWIESRKPFGKLEWIVIRSAIMNTPYKIILHTNLKKGEAGKYDPYKLKSKRFSIMHHLYSLDYNGIKLKEATLSDILRIEYLQKYGGIYSDTDLVWFKPLPLSLETNKLIGNWENKSYKILTNNLIAAEKGYNFTPLLKEFDEILEGLKAKGVKNISESTLKNHMTLFYATGTFIKKHATDILERKYYMRNGWRMCQKIIQGELPPEKLKLDDIYGFHVGNSVEGFKLLDIHKGLQEKLEPYMGTSVKNIEETRKTKGKNKSTEKNTTRKKKSEDK